MIALDSENIETYERELRNGHSYQFNTITNARVYVCIAHTLGESFWIKYRNDIFESAKVLKHTEIKRACQSLTRTYSRAR